MAHNYLYRADIVSDRGVVHITYRQYRVTEETPCGCWIGNPKFCSSDKWKWVSNSAKKRFAYPTQAQALASLQARKRIHLAYLNEEVRKIQIALGMLNKHYEEEARNERRPAV